MSRERPFEDWYTPEPNTGCWIWEGADRGHGYGIHRYVAAHRFSYEKHRGPIPEGMVLDHRCRVKMCVNPDHLRPVTARQNVLENSVSLAAINVQKTQCIRSHEFTLENTYRSPHGHRTCRICIRVSQKKYRLLRKERQWNQDRK